MAKTKKPKKSRPATPQSVKNYLRENGIPPFADSYRRKLLAICQDFVVGDCLISHRLETREVYSRKPTYLAFYRYDEDFKNPFYGNEENLEKFIGRKFGINTEFDYTMILSEPDSIQFCLSMNLDETVAGEKVPAFHAILVAIGKIPILKNKDKINDFVDSILD